MLAGRIGEPADARVVVTGAASTTPFAIRVMADVRRFDGVEIRERVLLELPVGRAPPQGGILELRARPVAPRGPETGFDERGWLERRGVHVVLHASGRLAARRPAGWDRWRRRPAAHGCRRCPLARDDRRAAVARPRGRPRRRPGHRPGAARRVQGLRALSPAGRLRAEHRPDRVRRPRPRLRRRPRPRRRTSAGDRGDPRVRARRRLAAVGRPRRGRGVPRLGRVAALASDATAGTRWRPGPWCCSRGRRARPSSRASSSRSRPSPRSSSRCRGCAASPRAIRCRVWLVEVVGISAACGIATAPILWLQFGTIPLWTVPANALAEPAMPVLLGCRARVGGARAADPLRGARALVARRGSPAAWIAFSARLIAAPPVRTDLVARRRRRHRRGDPASPRAARAAAVPPPRHGRARPSHSSPRRGRLVGSCIPPPRWSPPAGLRVSFLDVGQGDGILLETPQGALLVDAGPARGARRPAAAAAGPAPARRARRLARASRPRRRRRRSAASLCGRRGDRPAAARPGAGRAGAAADGARAARPARRRARRAGRTCSGGSGSRSSGRTTRARPTRTRICTAPSCSRATAPSTCSCRATPSRR